MMTDFLSVPDAEPFDSCQHPVWVAVGEVADLPAVVAAVGGKEPDWAVSGLIEASVRAALGAVGYRMDRPRAFELGDAEPDDVAEVYDPARRRWARGHDGLWFMPETTSPHLPWVELLDRTGELVEALPTPASPTRAEVIERAAEVFCDSAANGVRWADLGEPLRAMYRRRQAAVADAGLLADPAMFAEIARLRVERDAARGEAERLRGDAERASDPRSWVAVWRPYDGPAEQWQHNEAACLFGQDGVMEFRRPVRPAGRGPALSGLALRAAEEADDAGEPDELTPISPEVVSGD
jgi:hypothetical protein